MKIAMNTQMHEEFKWRYQNAELKQGLTSKTFQNSLKFWYFRVIKKQNNGRLLHLVKNTDAHYEQMTTSIQNKPDDYSDSRLWLCPMKEHWK